MDQQIINPGQTPMSGTDEGMPLKVNLKEIPDITCGSCGGNLWEQAIILKRISPIQSPTGKEEYVTIPVLVCIACRQPMMTVSLNKNPVEPEPPTQQPPAQTPPPAQAPPAPAAVQNPDVEAEISPDLPDIGA